MKIQLSSPDLLDAERTVSSSVSRMQQPQSTRKIDKSDKRPYRLADALGIDGRPEAL